MRQAVISYLYEKGDREDITNGRTILPPNYDHKIYTEIEIYKYNRNIIDIYKNETFR